VLTDLSGHVQTICLVQSKKASKLLIT